MCALRVCAPLLFSDLTLTKTGRARNNLASWRANLIKTPRGCSLAPSAQFNSGRSPHFRQVLTPAVSTHRLSSQSDSPMSARRSHPSITLPSLLACLRHSKRLRPWLCVRMEQSFQVAFAMRDDIETSQKKVCGTLSDDESGTTHQDE